MADYTESIKNHLNVVSDAAEELASVMAAMNIRSETINDLSVERLCELRRQWNAVQNSAATLYYFLDREIWFR